MHRLTEVSGGGNGLSIFPTSVHYDIPVVDGDAMGRAYPTMYQGKEPGTVITILEELKTDIIYLTSDVECVRSSLDSLCSLRRKGKRLRCDGQKSLRNNLCSLLN